MSTPARIEEDLYLNWWGLLRRPPIYVEANVRRLEVVAAGLLLGLVLLFVWSLLCMGLGYVGDYLGWQLGVSVAISAALLATPALAAAVVPMRLVEGSKLADLLLAMRERGDLRRFDSGLLAFAVALSAAVAARLIGGGIQRLDLEPLVATLAVPSVVALCVGCVAATVALLLLPQATFVSRGRTTTQPAWLRTWLEQRERDGVQTLDIPEAESTFAYAFPCEESARGRVGIRLTEGVLAELRRINTEHEGRLYQREEFRYALAVVLGAAPPVNGLGVDDMRRLTAQLIHLAREAAWTPYQFAGEILRFVQRNVRYVFDEESTQRILGRRFDEYGRFPLETLIDAEGDCECTSILCAALLAYAGFSSALFLVSFAATPFEPEEYHIAVGLLAEGVAQPPVNERSVEGLSLVHKGRRYLYGETATDSSSPDGFGVIPDCWRQRMKLEAVVEIPAYRG